MYTILVIIHYVKIERKNGMIKSMTGFGRSEYNDGKRIITVEVKSVNHRFFDITIKMPRRYTFAEDKVKQKVKEKLNRGKVDVSIMVENITENDVSIKLNEPVAKQYFDSLQELKSKFAVFGEIELSILASMPEVIKATADIDDEEEITNAILVPVSDACANLENMREIEGEKLAFKGVALVVEVGL